MTIEPRLLTTTELLSPETKNRIRALWRRGAVAEAKELQIAVDSARYKRALHRKIVTLRLYGASADVIAATCRYSRATIFNVLRRYGVSVRREGYFPHAGTWEELEIDRTQFPAADVFQMTNCYFNSHARQLD